ncbi:hypothetical protein NHH03_21090 [Stieleria sp. TO1_6]|uniref:hypothetical protein n=1 Tax=Stieleria tagensis TaxID=2956795 RepID=UPI00209B8AB6|nr:hypothetical protein [Stieleria tagensis]MCO8124252.1 hypothetical protein [Stieleria tagensis]
MKPHAKFLIIPLLVVLSAINGCSSRNDEPVAEAPSLPTIRGSELQRFVTDTELPVLVEFGVDYQCERCRQMKQPVVELGKQFEGRVKVVFPQQAIQRLGPAIPGSVPSTISAQWFDPNVHRSVLQGSRRTRRPDSGS